MCNIANDFFAHIRRYCDIHINEYSTQYTSIKSAHNRLDIFFSGSRTASFLLGKFCFQSSYTGDPLRLQCRLHSRMEQKIHTCRYLICIIHTWYMILTSCIVILILIFDKFCSLDLICHTSFPRFGSLKKMSANFLVT